MGPEMKDLVQLTGKKKTLRFLEGSAKESEDFPVAEKKISKCTDHVIIIIHYCYYVCTSNYYYYILLHDILQRSEPGTNGRDLAIDVVPGLCLPSSSSAGASNDS